MILSVVTSEETKDRLDPGYYNPDYVSLESRLHKAGAVELRTLADISKQRANPSDEPNLRFKYVEIDDINNETGQILAQELLGSEAPSRARRIIRKNEILLSMVRPNRRIVALVPPELDGAVCSTGFAVIRTKSIDPFYLFGFLKTNTATNQLIRRTSSSMYPTVTEEDIGDILVPKIEGTELLISNQIRESVALIEKGRLKMNNTLERLNRAFAL
jgi:type I restriction enzyme S subunit